jgi:hypothetical protein
MALLLRTAIGWAWLSVLWAWLSVLLLGCSRPTLYSWGHYEEQAYASHVSAGTTSLEAQAAELERDGEKARAERKRMPPGFHAQLAHLYVQLGKLDQARLELEAEKAEFPESAVFVDRALASLPKP